MPHVPCSALNSSDHIQQRRDDDTWLAGRSDRCVFGSAVRAIRNLAYQSQQGCLFCKFGVLLACSSLKDGAADDGNESSSEWQSCFGGDLGLNRQILRRSAVQEKKSIFVQHLGVAITSDRNVSEESSSKFHQRRRILEFRPNATSQSAGMRWMMAESKQSEERGANKSFPAARICP